MKFHFALLLLFLALGGLAFAQDDAPEEAKPAEDAAEPAEEVESPKTEEVEGGEPDKEKLKEAIDAEAGDRNVQPLPKGKIEVLKAIVMEVKGVAQARTGDDGGWKKLAVNDVLTAGVVIRTGRKSYVALRVGKNASVLVERQSRVALPEMVQDGDVLRTRMTMKFGKTDVKVDRVGLRNDFGVTTPTATLAVRGTVFRILWNAVVGFKAIGVPGNRIRAIELRYLNSLKAYLSGADASSDEYKLPAVQAFYETYLRPLQGAISPGEDGDPTQAGTDFVDNPQSTTGVEAAQRARGDKTQRGGGGQDNPPTNPSDG